MSSNAANSSVSAPSTLPAPVKQAPLPMAATLGISCTAGLIGWCFAHPFEMWKTTVMMSPPGTSLADGFRKTAQKGFYTGLSNGLTRQVVYTTARLGFYPLVRDNLIKGEVALGLRQSADPACANMFDRVVAGGLAGVFASFLSSPIEVSLVLSMASTEKMSMPQALASVWTNTGLAGYWRGFGALGSRAALVGMAQVGVHDQVLTKLRIYNRARPSQYNDNLVVNVASVITALIYSTITMPIETARVRMSAEARLPLGTEKRYHNAIQCVGRIFREEGCTALYDSFLPYFSRCATHTVLCFFVIEYMNRAYRARQAKLSATS